MNISKTKVTFSHYKVAFLDFTNLLFYVYNIRVDIGKRFVCFNNSNKKGLTVDHG